MKNFVLIFIVLFFIFVFFKMSGNKQLIFQCYKNGKLVVDKQVSQVHLIEADTGFDYCLVVKRTFTGHMQNQF